MVAVAVLAVVLFGVPLGIAVGRLYRSQEISRLERIATQLATQSTASLGDDDPATVPAMPEDPPHTTVSAYDAQGHLVIGDPLNKPSEAIAGALQGTLQAHQEGGDLVVAVPVSEDQQIIGIIRVASPVSRVWLRTLRTWSAMAGLGLAVIAIATVAARTLARRLSRPVAAVARAAHALGEGDFSVRLPTSGLEELDEAVGAINITASRLGDLVARERAFSADASHQLRTPLTGLRLTLESAMETPGANLRRAMRDAVAEVDRLEATVDDLLALARDTERPREPVDLNRLCADAVSRWEADLKAKGRALRLRVENPKTAPVRASPAAVQQVLDVLLDNAATHGKGTVIVRVRSAPRGAAIEVADEGPGPSDPAAAFQRRAAGSGGHGIGLALARSLAEAEGGRLLLTQTRPPIFAFVLPEAR